jgi:hypothetical protein
MESENVKHRLSNLSAQLTPNLPQEQVEVYPPPSKETLEEVRILFDRYAEQINRSALSQSSKTMYIDFADCFVRWTCGGFIPGELGTRRRRSSKRAEYYYPGSEKPGL